MWTQHILKPYLGLICRTNVGHGYSFSNLLYLFSFSKSMWKWMSLGFRKPVQLYACAFGIYHWSPLSADLFWVRKLMFQQDRTDPSFCVNKYMKAWKHSDWHHVSSSVNISPNIHTVHKQSNRVSMWFVLHWYWECLFIPLGVAVWMKQCDIWPIGAFSLAQPANIAHLIGLDFGPGGGALYRDSHYGGTEDNGKKSLIVTKLKL